MIACPSCQRSVEDTEQHYGTLFTCPYCNAVYFIDWGGQPEVATHEVEAPADQPEQTFDPTPDFSPPAQDYSSQGYEQPAQDFSQDQDFGQPQDFGQSQNFEQPSEQNFEQPAQGYESAEQSYEQQPGETSGYETPAQDAYTSVEPTEAEPEPYDFNKPLDHVEPAPSIADTSDFSDVTDFANANTVTGPLAYTVIIEGIESSQLVNLLKEAMTDSRFGWDVTGHLLRIGGGKLVIEGLNPAKASILVQRLKYLPLKISWRQDVLS